MTEIVLGCSRIAGPQACSRILLVGELNPYGADPGYALYHEPPNSAGGRLQRLILGVSARRWYLPIWRTNLCEGAWDMDEALDGAGVVLGLDQAPGPWDVIVALGVSVNSALRRRAFRTLTHLTSWPEPFETIGLVLSTHQVTVVNLPHPSGRNLVWNEPDRVQAARDLMRRLVPEIPWGDRDA